MRDLRFCMFGDRGRNRCVAFFGMESLRGDIAPRRSKGQNSSASNGEMLASSDDVTGTIMANCGTKQWLGNQEAFSGDYHVCTLGHSKSNGLGITNTDIGNTLEATNSCNQAVAYNNSIRRFTPIECERLQGFPDNYTNIPEVSNDSVRYKAIGNSMAVPVMKWIGQRIDMVDKIICG